MVLAAVLLGVAISVEVASTAALPRTAGFTSLPWTVGVVGGYALSIFLLSVVVRRIPVAVTYAVWSGAGTLLVAAVGVVLLHERLNPYQVASLGLIIVGVVGLNLAASR